MSKEKLCNICKYRHRFDGCECCECRDVITDELKVENKTLRDLVSEWYWAIQQSDLEKLFPDEIKLSKKALYGIGGKP